MRQRVGVADFGGSWGAFAFDLPGCVANAGSRDELLAIAPVALASHFAWLHGHDLAARPDTSAEIDVVEEICAANEPAVEGEFCFEDDLQGATDEQIEYGMRAMAASRGDLLAAVAGVPDAILDWRPPASAMAQIDEWKPQPLTIREILDDIASAESYYRTGLHDGRLDESNASAGDLTQQREQLVQTLRELPRGDRARRFEPIRSWQSAPEHWTARKVIRRVISHEFFHAAEIRQRLAWLLVGVPQFRRK